MTYTEQQIAAALGSQIFYEHTDPRVLDAKYTDEAIDKRNYRETMQKGHIPSHLKPLAGAVARVFGIEPHLIASDSRRHRVVDAKRMFCWMMKTHSNLSLPQIASLTGTDHSTVIYHYNKFEKRKHEHADDIARVLAEWKR